MTETILQHEISYFFREDEQRELNECDIEHIEEAIKEGYNQGELCQIDCSNHDEIEYRGWWKIVKGEQNEKRN